MYHIFIDKDTAALIHLNGCMTNMNKADYNQNHNSTSINHFYEKLLLLKDMMNTETAKKMAEHKQAVMEDFLEEFMAEWKGEK